MAIEMAKELDDKLVGQLLASRYLIEHKLGEGAMGAVYRARHVKVGRRFAVKVLHSRLLDDQKLAQRFDREAELAGRLHHPNVIGVVDVGETPDGLRYMVMDFAEGTELTELIAEAPFPPERIIHLVRQLLEGLYHAHEAGLIHRDFKPENVIVERDDHGAEVTRIVDFGISILREGGDSNDGTGRLTTNGLVLGTPHYMAPEQAVADPIDHRIDLFAMGIVIYEMLSGTLPFDGAGAEVARANLLLDPPPISQRVPGLEVDPLLEAFARRLMAKKRDHRPATAKQARQLLDLIERDRPAAAAALGVPLEQSGPAPKVTQPMEPEPQVPRATASTTPVTTAAGPAIEAAQAPALRPTDEAAPPPRPTDVEAAPPAGTAARATSIAEPLPWRDARPASKRRWLIAGGAGLVAAGAIAALALGAFGGGDTKPPGGPPVAAVAPTEPTAEPAPAPTTTPPPEAAGVTPVPAVTDPPPGPGTSEIQPPSGTDPDAGRPDPARPAPDRTKPTRPAKRPDPAASKPVATKPDATKPDAAKPDVAVKEPAVRIDPMSSGEAIEAEWRAVRAAIDAFARSRGKEAAADLLTRWRVVKIQPAQRNLEKRREAAAQLAEIRVLLAAAQKK